MTRFTGFDQRLQLLVRRKIGQQQRMDWLKQRLQQQHPGQKLAGNAQRLDELEQRLNQAVQGKLRHHHHWLEAKTARLWQHHPAAKISRLQQKQGFLQQRLENAMRHKLARLNQ